MTKLQVGDWIEHNGEPSILATDRKDKDGDYIIVVPKTKERGGWWDCATDLERLIPLKKKRWIAFPAARRSDQFTFRAFYSPDGKRFVISAGCQSFNKIDDAENHWKNRHRAFLWPIDGNVALYRRAQRKNDRLNLFALDYVAELKKAMAKQRAKVARQKARRARG